MSLLGTFRLVGAMTVRRALPVALALAAASVPTAGWSQPAPPMPMPAPAAPAPAPPVTAAPPSAAPGAVIVEPGPGVPMLPPEVQLVRFQAPEGVQIEVLGPVPDPVAIPAAQAEGLFGLKVGVGYRLRIANLPHREGAELFPVVEIVGHLHRPAGIDPTKFPIRVVFGEEDLIDAADHGRLVTKVIYLEDPEQALPLAMPRGEIPIVTLNPAEEPLKVGAALGRVMAIVRLGARRPSVEELDGERIMGAGMSGAGPLRCPFSGSDGRPCGLPCGPVRGTPPPPGRAWMPRDEFICDGGDHSEVAHFGGDGGLLGIDPRDAVVQFSTGTRPRILPTNLVCVYAPRFAEVRVSVGPNEALKVEGPLGAQKIEGHVALDSKQYSRKLVQNEAVEASRERARAAGLNGRIFAGVHSELRVLSGYENMAHVSGARRAQVANESGNRQKPGTLHEEVPPLAIKTAEGPIVTGIIEGAGEAVMSWPARETVGVEAPPNAPGLAVIKRVSSGEAEQGETLTFVIQYRNMGNTTIRAVSIVDSLLPRLGYVAGSAEGPKGTVFTAGENRVGSTELRWDLPGILVPGAEGHVSFRAVVR